MLTTAPLRQAAALSGARDLAALEIDVGLTHLLQLFHEKGLTGHLAFKGGTYLRKMVFGPQGRLSTDLDFTCRTGIALDELALALLAALAEPDRGITFRFDRSQDWYLTEEGCAANPVLIHAGNPVGVKIKIQVSTRERPLRPVALMSPVAQGYFRHLSFIPAAIPCLALEEVIAEKIRAAMQRSKIRDLYDLAELARRPMRKEMIRSLAVLKLWNRGGPGLDFERFKARIEDGRDYHLPDLRNLLRKDQSPDLAAMIARVVGNFGFLGQLTENERILASDAGQRHRVIADALAAALAAA